MQIRRGIAYLAIVGLLLFLPALAQAALIPSLNISVTDDTGTIAWPAKGSDPDGNGIYDYDGSRTSGGWSLNWTGTEVNPDPVVTAVFSVTNNLPVTNTFTIISSFPISPAITPVSITGGSVQGGVTDGNGNGATLATSPGAPLYYSQIDGVNWVPLYTDPYSVVVTKAFDSGNVPFASFGTPIPSLPGPAANSTIAIQLKFTLTPGDSASFTSVFVVEPVPEPASLLLLTSGAMMLGLFAYRRRLR